MHKWSPETQTDTASEDGHASPFHFAIEFPQDGDSIACVGGVDGVCAIDLELRASAKPKGGEVSTASLRACVHMSLNRY